HQSSWRGMIIGGVIVFVLAFAAMAVGTMMGRKPIQGSCGGMGSGGDAGCSLCGGQPEHCDRTSKMKPTTSDPEP
ncbi:MAG TPA: (Na+)-NQR maturation NqrM, partial [Pirellulaceae bacterium]|nr:(Na+)-NQR maturation NqrM [Pirellulaceae bacterium]